MFNTGIMTWSGDLACDPRHRKNRGPCQPEAAPGSSA
jgi:hypothetical protein